MKHAHTTPTIILSASLAMTGCTGSQHTQAEQPQTDTPVALQTTQADHEEQGEHALHNLHQLSPDLWSAGEPVGEDAYAELAALGIKTVISVDGVAPNKELATKHDITIVHLPIGYDGISEQRSRELAHAMATMPRPIFVNCHHGKHRGPAALCVGAIGSGDISTQQALDYMKLAKTSPKYTGLWHAADVARPLSEAELHDPGIELPEQAVIADRVGAMAELDRLNEFLWECADNDFKAPDHHPDLAPISLAGQIHNLLRGMEDDPDSQTEGPDYFALLITSRDLASTLETQLEQGDIKSAHQTIELLNNSCNDCHGKFRNTI